MDQAKKVFTATTALAVLGCCALAGGDAQAQARPNNRTLIRPRATTLLSAGGCTVGLLNLRITTGKDDLRGGNDNLNVTIHFADGTSQAEANVNHSQNWANGSVKGADILLNRPVSIDQIRGITLATTFIGGPAGDNWKMASMQADASLADGTYHTIAKSGFHRFSADWSGASAREITIRTQPIN